jgi:DNA-binding MarR family transcriptional regulator
VRAGPAALDRLARAVAYTSLALTDLAERLHAADGATAAHRGVLQSVARHGPSTVPQLARMRPVSRQYMQRTVDELLDRGWLAAGPNPDHRRSPKLSLTDGGRALLTRIAEREREWLGRMGGELGDAEVVAAADLLERIHALLLTHPPPGESP